MKSNSVSKGAIDYIENNLFDNLELDRIANEINYSKYHFHRLFLSDMGVSVAEYVRRRRLIRAASTLLLSVDKITDVSYNYGFNNVDTFIRCFKRYYGITPSEYRKLNIKSMKLYQEECCTMMNFMNELRECSVDDKKQAIKSLDKVIELSRIAHKKGVLALEDAIEEGECSYLIKAIELLIDGLNPQILRNILSNYIVTSNLSPLEQLERVIYLEGILLIQEGEYPWNIRKNLSSCFGEDYIGKLNIHFQSRSDLMSTLQKYKSKEAIFLEKLLDNELKNMDKRSMQRLLRECDIIIIVVAFSGASSRLRKLVIELLPKGRQEIFSEVIDLVSEPSTAQIIDSQNEILSILKELRINKDIK